MTGMMERVAAALREYVQDASGWAMDDDLPCMVELRMAAARAVLKYR